MTDTATPHDQPSTTLDASEGDLAVHSPDAVLAFCEIERFTGTLRFESRAVSGNLPVLRGVPEIPEADRALTRAFEAFLAATDGRYALEEFLPDLEGATRVGDASFTGVLGEIEIADLLRYANAVGLTGVVLLSRPERGVVLRHRRGELVSISVNDEADADLVNLFAWKEGRFAIRTRSLFARTARLSDLPANSLHEIEVGLADVLARAGDRGSSAPPSAGVPGPSVLRARTLPFGLVHDGASRDSVDAPSKVEDDRWEPSAATTGRLRALASKPPPPSGDGTVKIYRVEKDPTGAFPAVRVSEPPPAPARAKPRNVREEPARHPGSVTARTAAVALRRARTMIFVLAGLLVATALLAAFLLGRVTK
jgi:hypothetical protein